MTTYNDYIISELDYSVGGNEWAAVKKDTEISFGGANGDLRLRGKNTAGTATGTVQYATYATITFTKSNVPVACTGDIRTLLDWNNYATVNTENARFIKLFENCSVLTSAPELPATTLARNCYACMFSGCTNLKTAPELKATALADCCYASMFSGCTNLKTAPKLPAKISRVECYANMFSGCTNLKSAELSIEFLYRSCCDAMFNNCTNLSSVTMLAPSKEITLSGSSCLYYWLNNAGTDQSVQNRTLKVQDKAAYEALKANANCLPAKWQIGKCTVLDKDGNVITE